MIEPHRSDPALGLARALRSRLGEIELLSLTGTPWASVTFTGTRLVLVVRADPLAADRLLLDLADAEWRIPGHLIADIAAVAEPDGDRTRLTIEALTLVDAPHSDSFRGEHR